MYLLFRLTLRLVKVEEDVPDHELVVDHFALEERRVLGPEGDAPDGERVLPVDVDLPGPDLALRGRLVLDGVEDQLGHG